MFASQAGVGDDASQGGEEDNKKYYLRAKSDVRILYEMRLPRMKNIVLGFFASRYRKVKASGNGYQVTKVRIDHMVKSELIIWSNHTMYDFVPREIPIRSNNWGMCLYMV